MKRTRSGLIFILNLAAVVLLGSPAFAQTRNPAATAPVVNAGPGQTVTSAAGDPAISTNTCAAPASSASVADPFTTTFSVTVKPGDTVLSVVDGYRAVGKTISSVVFNGSQNLSKSAGTLGNTMGAEIWSLKNPTATTANIVITYTNGGTFVFDKACARTFTGVDLPIQSSATFTAANASAGLSLAGLTSTSDKAIFVDLAACNCGGLAMIAETNRTLGLNAGPNQVGSSTIITKSPAGNDTMPWSSPAVQATQVGVVYPPLFNPGTNTAPVVSAGAGQTITLPAGASLSGTATDDGLPTGTLQTTWSKFNGPGTVSFANASALSTTATFSTAGTYVLRLTASDTALSSTSDVTIVVNPPLNTAPVVSAGLNQTITPSAADPKLSANTCAAPASSASVAEPFITTFSVTVKPGDAVLSVVVGYRAAAKAVSTVVFNGSESLTKSVGILGNTMGAEIWSLKNPTATTANIVITYSNGGTFVFDSACARTFTGADLPVQSSARFTSADASAGISLTGLTSTSDKAVFVDIAACNCGGLTMIAEPNRTLGLNAGPNQVGSSTIITKSPAGNDTMPWTAAAVAASQAGVVYSPLLNIALANLSGTVTDDGLPNGTIQTTWSKFSGPGTVTFSNTSALNTTATFSTAGTYVLRLTASDTALSSSADVTITVNPGANTAPAVDAGADQTITLPAGANLSGTVTDDGLPNGAVQTTWTKFSGAGTVTFSNPSALNSTATFSTAGTYVLRLTADDGALTAYDDVSVVVNPPTNKAPVVTSGPAQTITLPAGANLSGTVTDDGLPAGNTVTTTWSKFSGPGTVTFSAATALNTAATFSTAGTYVLRLTASDGELSAGADVTITVNPVPVQTVDNSLSVMSTALGMQGQTNWYFYNSGDAPEGAYMGWLFQAQTLTGTVRLPRQLLPGRYYIFFYGICYDTNPTIQALIGGGTSTGVVLNDRDASKYWSDHAVVDVATASDTLQVLLTRNPGVSADQRFLFRGLYITDKADETMTFDGYAVKLIYPTVMDNSAPVKGNLVPNGGFETPIDASWGFLGQNLGRTVPLNTMWDSTQGYEGQGSLKIWFDPATRLLPTKGLEEFASRVYHLKPNKKYTVSMWVKTSPGLSTTATLSMVNTYVPPDGYPAQYILSTGALAVGDTWKRLSLTGYLLEYPTSDYQIHLAMPRQPIGTYLVVDDVQLEEGDLTDFAPAAAVEAGVFIDMNAQPANIFYTDEVLRADLVARNNTSAPMTKTLKYEIYDQLNRLLTQGSIPLTLPPLTTQRLPFDLSTGGKQGSFRLVTWIHNDDRTEKELVYSVIPRPLTTAADPASFLGIHGYSTDTQVKILQRLGMKWSRALSPSAWCRWSVAEPVDNQFVWFDAEVQRTNAYGISTVCTIGTNNEWPAWANNGGLPNLAKWQEFVGQLVSHYKSSIKHWEIWNEAYAAFSADFYAQMLRLAADAIEAEDPTAIIIGMGGSPPASIQAIITALETRYPTWDWKQHIDVLSTHAYPDGVPPEQLIPIINAYGLPVWNTEAGAWDIGFYQGVNSNFVVLGKNAWPNADATRYYNGTIGASTALVENFLRTLASGQKKYFYYDSRYFPGPDYFKTHPTIYEYDGTTRTKGIAYAIAGSLVDHSVSLGNASLDPHSYLLVFDKPDGPVASLFASDKNLRQIAISLSPAQFQVLDLMGNRVSLTGSAIPFGRIPVYLKGIGITAATLKAALQAGVVTTATDTTPPSVSISDAPRGPIANHAFRVRWIALDDSSYPNLGEIDPATNTSTGADPDAIQYSYYLNGYSASWSTWSAGTFVDFSDVPSGSYTFSVTAKDAAGNQSSAVSRTIVIN